MRSICALVLILSSCGTAETSEAPTEAGAPPEIVVVDAQALSAGMVEVDLRRNARYLFPTPAQYLPLTDVVIICPDERRSTLDVFLRHATEQLGEDPTGDGPFSVEDVARNIVRPAPDDGCHEQCGLCPDGALICTQKCETEVGESFGGDDGASTGGTLDERGGRQGQRGGETSGGGSSAPSTGGAGSGVGGGVSQP